MNNLFDWNYYLDKYPDLIKNGVNTQKQATQHWLNHGKKEGRVSIRTPDLFDWHYYLGKYPDLRENGIHTQQQAIEHWIKHGKQEGRTTLSNNTTGKKNILIYTHMEVFNINDGGTVVQYYLAKILEESFDQIVRIYSSSGKTDMSNPLFIKYYNYEFPIDENTIVIYCEGTIGNPLNAQYVVRWMLSELGQNAPREWLDTWGKDELVYYFNSELKFNKYPEKIGNTYKLLSLLYIKPDIKQTNYKERDQYCYTIRKGPDIHKNIIHIHPDNSFEITRQNTQDECIVFFNNYKYFISYDSLTFLIIIAALCGCIPIVYKIEGLSKQEWIQTTAASEYIKSTGLDNLYGIAYGLEDIKYAEDTIHLVKDQWIDITNYLIKKTVMPFINDINNFNNNPNTILNNYY